MTIDKKISIICLATIGIILLGVFWAVYFSHQCSIVHPEFCDRTCAEDIDCYSSAECGCLSADEKCLGDMNCETETSFCKCVNNVCQIARFGYNDMNCGSDFNCRLVYAGSNPCPPCDSSIDDYKCLNAEKAQEINNEKEQYRISKKIECGACPSPKYSCVCQNQSCEKTKIE